MRTHMRNLAKACDRHRMPDRAAVTIATATCFNVGTDAPKNPLK